MTVAVVINSTEEAHENLKETETDRKGDVCLFFTSSISFTTTYICFFFCLFSAYSTHTPNFSLWSISLPLFCPDVRVHDGSGNDIVKEWCVFVRAQLSACLLNGRAIFMISDKAEKVERLMKQLHGGSSH